MTTLITGGGSNIGSHLGRLLKAAGRKAVFASRSGNRIPEGFDSVKLDWSDVSTFDGALNAGPFESVYIIGTPGNHEPAKEIVPFIEAAIGKGVKKFVYLSGTGNFLEAGGLGQVGSYLKEKGINHVVLVPTWFTGEFVDARNIGERIADPRFREFNWLSDWCPHQGPVRDRYPNGPGPICCYTRHCKGSIQGNHRG
jgi:uncharacterized protein YbjT (DUF2867 family)